MKFCFFRGLEFKSAFDDCVKDGLSFQILMIIFDWRFKIYNFEQ